MFGKILKKLRLHKGLSQEKIANELHVVRQTISKWETGASSPYVEQLESILNLFDIEPNLLFGKNGGSSNEHHAVSGRYEHSKFSNGNCPDAAKKEEMIASIINRLEEMNESGVNALYDFITVFPVKERWMASTSKERIVELDAIEAQREQEAAQEKERTAKEAEEKATAKRKQLYRDYARMFNAINTVDIPTRYDMTIGEIEAIDFVCGEVRRYFPEYAFSVANKYFDYGFVNGMRCAKARTQQKKNRKNHQLLYRYYHKNPWAYKTFGH